MAESVLAVRDLNRILDEVIGPSESLIDRLFSADIVRAVAEFFNVTETETDEYQIAWGPQVDERLRVYEAPVSIRGIDFGILIEVIDEEMDFSETLLRFLTVVSDAIVKIKTEPFFIRDRWPPALYVRGRRFVKNNRLSIIEATDFILLYARVVNEALHIDEEALEFVIAVTFELLKVVNEGALWFIETSAVSIGIAPVINEVVSIYENAIQSFGYEVIQIVGDFSITAAIHGLFKFNKDIDR